MIELPPLPEPAVSYWGDFSEDQMRAYGEACARAALESYEADAMRYRWLRETDPLNFSDAAIDASMATSTRP